MEFLDCLGQKGLRSVKKWIIGHGEVSGDQRRLTSLQLATRCRQQAGARPITCVIRGLLSALCLLFNWPLRERESEREKEKCEETEGKGRGIEGLAGHQRAQTGTPLLSEEIGGRGQLALTAAENWLHHRERVVPIEVPRRLLLCRKEGNRMERSSERSPPERKRRQDN